jgi:hypothetical protein
LLWARDAQRATAFLERSNLGGNDKKATNMGSLPFRCFAAISPVW